MSEPQFKHFCDECTFLGPYKHGDKEYDLYHCEKKGETEALFARFGNETQEFLAAPATANFSSSGSTYGPALWQARRQARMQKLIT